MVVVKAFKNTGIDTLELRWTPPSSSEVVVPASAFYHASATGDCYSLEPRILNFAMQFELEDGQHVQLNL